MRDVCPCFVDHSAHKWNRCKEATSPAAVDCASMVGNAWYAEQWCAWTHVLCHPFNLSYRHDLLRAVCWRRNHIEREDLEAFLPADQAAEAFAMLNQDGDECLTLSEVRAACMALLSSHTSPSLSVW